MGAVNLGLDRAGLLLVVGVFGCVLEPAGLARGLGFEGVGGDGDTGADLLVGAGGGGGSGDFALDVKIATNGMRHSGHSSPSLCTV